jgi:hypothetical protein
VDTPVLPGGVAVEGPTVNFCRMTQAIRTKLPTNYEKREANIRRPATLPLTGSWPSGRDRT